MVRALADDCSTAGLPTRLEQSVLDDRIGDIVLINYQHNKDLYVDFTVASTLAPSYINKSARAVGTTGRERYNMKMLKYARQINLVEFEPMVVESLGGWHEEGLKILARIARMKSTKENLDPKSGLARLMMRYSFLLQKMNGAMLAARYTHSR